MNELCLFLFSDLVMVTGKAITNDLSLFRRSTQQHVNQAVL